MIEHTKIRPAAEKFVERFGREALAEASKRAAELRDAGNASGWATWVLMHKEVKAIVDGDTHKTKH